MQYPAFLIMALGAVALTACGDPKDNSGPGSKGEPGNAAPSAVSGAAAAEERRLRVEDGFRLPVRFTREGLQTMEVQAALERTGVPGLSVAVINDGALDWQAGYGTKNANEERPVSDTTLFQAASLSKPVTVLAAMRMRDAGLIDFDRDIHTYLKNYALPEGEQTPGNPVTFGNLLAHTSGMMPGGYAGYAVGVDIPSDEETLEGRAPADTDPAQVVSAPGSRLAYSGAAYTLVEQALQDVTGEPFAAIMDEWVLEPLDMQASTFAQPLPAELRPEAARGHRADGQALPGGWRVQPEQAAGGLWASAGDLAKVLLAIHGAREGQDDFLAPDSAKALFMEQMDGHAYGFILKGEDEAFSIRHFGGNEGYRSMMILYPETGDGAIFLTNSDAGHELIGLVVRAVADVYEWPDFQPVTVTRAHPEEAALKALAGTYRFDSGIKVGIDYSDERNAVSIEFPNGDVYELAPTGPEKFIHPATAVTVEFDGPDRLTVYGDTGIRVDDRD